MATSKALLSVMKDSAIINFHRYQGTAVAVILLCALCIFSILSAVCPSDRDENLGPNLSQEILATIDTGDTAWMMMATALTLFITPGISLFYGGMVRRSSILSILLQSITIMGMIIVLWSIVGFSLAFGDSWGSSRLIGNPSSFYFLRDVGAAPDERLAGSIPLSLFAMFEATFAMVAPTLMIGAVAERANFNALMVFIALWHLLVYCPLAHMQWHPDGLITYFGHKDFAGGLVVHMSSGFSALMLAYLVGPRREDKSCTQTPAHVPFVVLGTAFLWFGWFGFNGGSALGANYHAAQAIANTNISVGTSMCVWIVWDYIQKRKANVIGTCTAVVVGLVVITPGCGYVTCGGAMIMGTTVSIMTNVLLSKSQSFINVDDTLDVWVCHGLAGTMGMLLTACFATDRVYDDGLIGAFFGNGTFLWHSIVVSSLAIPFCLFMTTIIYHTVNYFIEFRVSESAERNGLDGSIHGEIPIGTFLDSFPSLRTPRTSV